VAMILGKLILLNEILNDRLPNVVMWSEVGLFFPGDRFPAGTLFEDTKIDDGHFIILWYHKRREDNPHPCHWKQIPLTIDELNSVIKRQREKLRTSVENV